MSSDSLSAFEESRTKSPKRSNFLLKRGERNVELANSFSCRGMNSCVDQNIICFVQAPLPSCVGPLVALGSRPLSLSSLRVNISV